MLCRLGCLPLMDRVGREQRPPWPKRYRMCVCCDMGVVEDVMHFMMECPMHAHRRAKLIGRVHSTVASALPQRQGAGIINFSGSSAAGQGDILFGLRIGDRRAEDKIDATVKRFLRKAWNARSSVTANINDVMGTRYEMYTARASSK